MFGVDNDCGGVGDVGSGDIGGISLLMRIMVFGVDCGVGDCGSGDIGGISLLMGIMVFGVDGDCGGGDGGSGDIGGISLLMAMTACVVDVDDGDNSSGDSNIMILWWCTRFLCCDSWSWICHHCFPCNDRLL